jgi:hypothetical protein
LRERRYSKKRDREKQREEGGRERETGAIDNLGKSIKIERESR